MTITLPPELEQSLLVRAQQRKVSVEQLMREALDWYLQMDAATIDELEAWQEIHDEALELVEDPPLEPR